MHNSNIDIMLSLMKLLSLLNVAPSREAPSKLPLREMAETKMVFGYFFKFFPATCFKIASSGPAMDSTRPADAEFQPSAVARKSNGLLATSCLKDCCTLVGHKDY